MDKDGFYRLESPLGKYSAEFPKYFFFNKIHSVSSYFPLCSLIFSLRFVQKKKVEWICGKKFFVAVIVSVVLHNKFNSVFFFALDTSTNTT